MRTLLFLVLLHGLRRPVLASVGDRSPAFQTCVARCVSGCSSDAVLPLSLRWARWSCKDNCAYICMHDLTDAATSTATSAREKVIALPGLPPDRVVQFYGKWPFYRFFGVQEPLSVLFSLSNLYMHAKYGFSLHQQLPPDFPKSLGRAYAMLPYAGINLWIWSIVFHTRDKAWTEKLDYFSAACSMLCNLYVAIVRLGGLYPTPQNPTSHRGSIVRGLLMVFLLVAFLAHVLYLTFWRFDYGYNMAFNVSIGLLHNLLWSSWSLYHFFLPSRTSPYPRSVSAHSVEPKVCAPHFAQPFLVLTLFGSLTLLELLDFPPVLRLLDAHAVWHASTIIIVKWWYQVLLTDAWWLVGREDHLSDMQKRFRSNSIAKGERLA